MNEKILKETFISGIRSGNLDLELNDTIVDDFSSILYGRLLRVQRNARRRDCKPNVKMRPSQ